MKNLDDESARERQSRVSKAGSNWEKFVKGYLEEGLKSSKIEILKEKEAKNSDKLNELLSIPTGFKEETIWNDVDLLAVKNNLPVAVINCKSSIHGRQSFYFWGLVFSINRRIKFIVATPDSGRSGGNGWNSEWGSPDKPSKYRNLARRYLDGVYVKNSPEFCKGIKEDEHTKCGGIVRELKELPSDLQRWSKDIKFYHVE